MPLYDFFSLLCLKNAMVFDTIKMVCLCICLSAEVCLLFSPFFWSINIFYVSIFFDFPSFESKLFANSLYSERCRVRRVNQLSKKWKIVRNTQNWIMTEIVSLLQSSLWHACKIVCIRIHVRREIVYKQINNIML